VIPGAKVFTRIALSDITWHLFTILIVGFSILLRVYSQSQIKPPYATQYSVFILYYINLKRDFKDFNTLTCFIRDTP
jgi:hypothetical protein